MKQKRLFNLNCSPLCSNRSEDDFATGTSVLTRPKQDSHTKKPRMYQVLLHNDDFTPRAFVVFVLQEIFNIGENSAVSIMMNAHKTGMARVAVYSFAIAETKVYQANNLSLKQEYPLKFSFEPIDNGDKGDP